MGKSLSYCFKCSKLVREEEFVKGKAFNLGDKVSCAACARQVGAVVTPGAAAPPPPPPVPTPRTKLIVIHEPGKAKAVMFVAVGALVLASVAIAVAIGVSRGPEASAPIPPPAAPGPREAAARPAPEPARKPTEKVATDKKEPAVRTEPVLKPAGIDPDLVGHWTFDEGQGTTAKDSSGRGADGEVKGATWVEGRIGKALHFNGVHSYVEFPNTQELDTLQENSYTIAAWYKPEAEPPGKEGNRGAAIVMKEGYHEGLALKERFGMFHWLFEGTSASATFPNPRHPPGSYYHLVGVVDRSQGLTRIVVDGKELGIRRFAPGARAFHYKKARWRVGITFIQTTVHHFPAHGIIDDVRLYKRALTDEEIQRLIPK